MISIPGLLSSSSVPSVDDPFIADPGPVRSNTGTLNSDVLRRGTPPPSYAEVLASISTYDISGCAEEQPLATAVPPESSAENQEPTRTSLSLPRQRRPQDPQTAIQRFSLQLALDCSSGSSASSSATSLSQTHQLTCSSSSSAASSLAPIDHL